MKARACHMEVELGRPEHVVDLKERVAVAAAPRIRQHTSAYVARYVSIRQHTSAYMSVSP
jgi:hypothetical protein